MHFPSIMSHSSQSLTHHAFSKSLHLLIPALAFTNPSLNPIFLARLAASSYLCRASPSLPSISKNSPKLCVATAQPTSHSSFRSGALMWAACASARSAHCRAWSMRRARGAEFETGKSEGSGAMVMASVVEGGVCWTRQVDMLFTVVEFVSMEERGGVVYVLRTTLWHDVGGQSWSALTNSGAAR